MKRKSLLFALLVALLLVMLPLQAMAAQGEGVTPEDGDISIEIPSSPSTPAVYTVVFKDADGTVLSMQNYNYGDAVVAPEAPSKAADETYTYEFAGWNKEVTNCVGNAVYTATYTQAYVEYTVKFLNEDGTEISSAVYHYGDTVVVPEAPVKAEDENYTYEFAGWDKEVVAVAGDAVYNATFTATEKVVEVENAIVQQPVSVTVDTGNEVQFKVVATGDVVSYKWEYRKVWKFFNTSMTGYNTDTLTVPANGARNGYGYRCTVTFADGTVLVSDVAKLTVNTFITDVQNPNDQTVVLGYKGQFTAAAQGEGIKYQWQYKRPDGTAWIDTAMEGCTKPTVLIETTAARDGYQYRCEITDVTGNVTVYTEPATMRVLSFKSHPEEAFAATGSTVTFSVTTSVADGFTYQWQYSKNGESWSNTTMTGYNTDTLTVDATLARNGYYYRCVLTGSKNSKIESKAAVLHVGDPVVITSQPTDITVAAGEIASFSVVAENAYSYQWYYRRSATATTSGKTGADGNETATVNITTKASNNGYQYWCVIQGLDGKTYTTDVVTLTVQ
ncbi:MAG: InlB B-repeat-containing protein [Oscillospiraceae bacterium]|nr:InlB B-repeat-containing protein [Oscillospiraceae bacterium]